MPKYLVQYNVKGCGQMIIEAGDPEHAQEVLDEIKSMDIVSISGLDEVWADRVTEVTAETDIDNIFHYEEHLDREVIVTGLGQYWVDGHVGSAGNNKNLFVIAPDPNTAVRLWMTYYSITPEELREAADYYSDVRLIAVPPIAQNPSPHGWAEEAQQWDVLPTGRVGPYTERD